MATKSIAWDSGGGYITLTYTGSGNGSISVTSDENPLSTSRSKTITIQTVGGAITKNLTISQGACPFPVGQVNNYSYTGSYQSVTLPPGTYKLQCWGAQGGTCSDGYSGGKGGYSEGVLTLTSATVVRIYVGGQGGSSSGGFNGGGSSPGSSSYSSDNTYGRSSMAGGGGATDIRLSDGALLSRMIVAGGGSGGAFCYKEETITTTTTEYVLIAESSSYDHHYSRYHVMLYNAEVTPGDTIKLTYNVNAILYFYASSDHADNTGHIAGYNFYAGGVTSSSTYTVPDGAYYACITYYSTVSDNSYPTDFYVRIDKEETITSTETITDSDNQSGYAGGGTNGVGYSSSYYGKQNGAGSGGSFGQGANQTATNYRFCSGGGGGGWYGGGGGQYSDSDMNTVHLSGGGSGWVNISANAGNRPSGYTGLQLDSGSTKDGNTSFESPSGGTETGHSGNGYARITRIA